jgi:hypothetical protein
MTKKMFNSVLDRLKISRKLKERKATLALKRRKELEKQKIKKQKEQ